MRSSSCAATKRPALRHGICGREIPKSTAPAAVLARGRSHGRATYARRRTVDALVPFETSAHEMRAAANHSIHVDVIFPVLHGTFGEDGTIQGLLELADIPYVGAGVLGSSAGMDKDVMKKLFRAAGLPIVKHVTVLRRSGRAIPGKFAADRERLEVPGFVKPANLGCRWASESP